MLRASMPSLRTVVLFAGLLAMLAVTIVLPVGAEALSAQDTIIPVRGQILKDDAPWGNFKGKVINPTVTYDADAQNLRIAGKLVGTLTRADGGVTREVSKNFNQVAELSSAANASDVTAQQRRCQILFLDIRPIFLDLLGLQVSLSRVTLDLTAVRGAGNLLGNLLCALVGLLDPGDTLANADSARFLNNLLPRLF
jgi:hypothetical protein